MAETSVEGRDLSVLLGNTGAEGEQVRAVAVVLFAELTAQRGDDRRLTRGCDFVALLGRAALTRTQVPDAGGEVGVLVEELGGDPGGAGDSGKTDLAAVLEEGSDAPLGGLLGSCSAISSRIAQGFCASLGCVCAVVGGVGAGHGSRRFSRALERAVAWAPSVTIWTGTLPRERVPGPVTVGRPMSWG